MKEVLSPQSDNVRFPQSRIVLFSGLPPREDVRLNLFGWKITIAGKRFRDQLKAVLQDLMPSIWDWVLGEYIPSIPNEQEAWELWLRTDTKIADAYIRLDLRDRDVLRNGGGAAFLRLLRQRLGG